MPFRFHRSFSVFPGLKLNINKKSASLTVGLGPVHYTVNTNGQKTLSVGFGGGLSWQKTFGGTRGSSFRQAALLGIGWPTGTASALSYAALFVHSKITNGTVGSSFAVAKNLMSTIWRII